MPFVPSALQVGGQFGIRCFTSLLLISSLGCSRDGERELAPLAVSPPTGSLSPVTTIIRPCSIPQLGVVSPPGFLKVAWTAEDPVSPDQRPDFYEWKLIPVPYIFNVGDANHGVLVYPGAQYPWIRAEKGAPVAGLILDAPSDYIFAVRSIGAAADTESTFAFGRNVLRIAPLQADKYGGHLVLTDRYLGSLDFSTTGVYEYEVAPRCFQFTFRASGQFHCPGGEEFNYGVDVENHEDDGPGSGFKGWSEKPFTEALCLSPRVEPYRLTIKARNDVGDIGRATINLRVTHLAFDREVLYVDDYRQASSDAFSDARMNEMLQAAGYPAKDIHQFDAFGPSDAFTIPDIPSLAELGRYKLIVWSTKGTAYNGNPLLVAMTDCQSNIFREYLRAGGAVWITGDQVFGATLAIPNGDCRAVVNYSETLGIGFWSPEFICDMLRICGMEVRTAKSDTRSNGLERGIPSAIATTEFFPRVEVDSTVFNFAGVGGIPFIDAAFEFFPTPGLDVLYTVDANSPSSLFNGKPTGFRYFDPGPTPAGGPLFVFGFSLHYLKPGSAVERTGTHGMARAVVEWVRSHQGPTGVGDGSKGVTP